MLEKVKFFIENIDVNHDYGVELTILNGILMEEIRDDSGANSISITVSSIVDILVCRIIQVHLIHNNNYGVDFVKIATALENILKDTYSEYMANKDGYLPTQLINEGLCKLVLDPINNLEQIMYIAILGYKNGLEPEDYYIVPKISTE